MSGLHFFVQILSEVVGQSFPPTYFNLQYGMKDFSLPWQIDMLLSMFG